MHVRPQNVDDLRQNCEWADIAGSQHTRVRAAFGVGSQNPRVWAAFGDGSQHIRIWADLGDRLARIFGCVRVGRGSIFCACRSAGIRGGGQRDLHWLRCVAASPGVGFGAALTLTIHQGSRTRLSGVWSYWSSEGLRGAFR
jgi:hypothetical protein